MASWLVNLRQPFYGRTVSLGHCSQMRCEDFIPESLVCSMISLYAQSLFTVRMSHHERGTASVKVLGINCALVQGIPGQQSGGSASDGFLFLPPRCTVRKARSGLRFGE